MKDYTIHGVPPTDVAVALRCEADRARSEQMHGTAKRQESLALHIENAAHQLRNLLPEGHHLQMDVVFRAVPDVNPVLRPEFRS